MALRPGKFYGPRILIGKVDPVSFKRQLPRGDAKVLEQVLSTLKRYHGLDFSVERFLGVTTLDKKRASGPMHADQHVLIRVTGGAGWLVWGSGSACQEIIEYGDWILVPPNTNCSIAGDQSFDQTDHPLVVTAARLKPKKLGRGDTPGKSGRPQLEW